MSEDKSWYVPGRRYQKTRDPESLLIEERAQEDAAAGYPPIEHERAMDAEGILERIKQARGAELAKQGAQKLRYQKVRDPACLAVEARAAERAKLGYPSIEHDVAMDAHDVIEAAKQARDAKQD